MIFFLDRPNEESSDYSTDMLFVAVSKSSLVTVGLCTDWASLLFIQPATEAQ